MLRSRSLRASQRLGNPAAAENDVSIIKHGGLARSDRAHRFIEAHDRLPVRPRFDRCERSNVAMPHPHLRASEGRALYISSYAVRQSLPGLGLYRVSKIALDGLIECWRMEHPDVDFTRVVVGNTSSTGFADGWEPERLRRALRIWVERNLFPAATMMSLDTLAESLVDLLATPAYVDDIAIMPRIRDAKAAPS